MSATCLKSQPNLAYAGKVLNIVKISLYKYVQLSIFCRKIIEKCWVCVIVKGFFFYPELLFRVEFVRALMPVLNKEKNFK